MQASAAARRYAVIGAGAAGIASAKYLPSAGFADITAYEIGSKIGGLWCNDNDNNLLSAYKTLHINSAKNVTHFSNFPFPDGPQPIPEHVDMYNYLNTEHFGVVPLIRFRRGIAEITPVRQPDSAELKWQLRTSFDEVGIFDRVIVASGQLPTPMHDERIKSNFKGKYQHYHHSHDPADFVGQRVCVIDAGNSACDIAADVCMTAKCTVMVARLGVLISPKLVLGKPFTDVTLQLERWWIRGFVRDRIISGLIRLVHGRMTKLGFGPLIKRSIRPVTPPSAESVKGGVGHVRHV